MIISCRIGDIESMIDTEDSAYVPEVAADLLNRAADATLRMWAHIPSDEATGDGQ